MLNESTKPYTLSKVDSVEDLLGTSTCALLELPYLCWIRRENSKISSGSKRALNWCATAFASDARHGSDGPQSSIVRLVVQRTWMCFGRTV
uniref:Uncharacterized protein n=1 Tax=Arundo donax TaxID=35708 RepID=A0A0A9DTD5_ARUDO